MSPEPDNLRVSREESRQTPERKSRRRNRSNDTETSTDSSIERERRRKKRQRRRRRRTRSSSPESNQRPSTSRQSNAALSPEDMVKILSVLQGMPSKSTLSFNQNLNVIPEFDPNNKSQTTERWLNKVNECSVIYGWDERQTMHFALQKLCGLAKKWYESLPTVNYTWVEWQDKLIKAFPNEENYGKLLEEMLLRVSRPEESLREYFYEKLSLVTRCEIRGRKAVECIIYGITAISIRNGAQALKCNEPEDLLNYLVSQHPQPRTLASTNYRRRDHQRLNNSFNASNSPTTKTTTASPTTNNQSHCFNCQEKGHFFDSCPKPLIKCRKCFRIGHDSENCNRKPLASIGNSREIASSKNMKIS